MWDFVSGWAAGIAGVTVGYPFDTVKVNQQTQGISTIRCMRTIYEQSGVKGFFRGLAFPLFGSGVIASTYFGVYKLTFNALTELEAHRRQQNFQTAALLGLPLPSSTTSISKISNNNNSNNNSSFYTICFLSGCTAGITQAFIMCPVELVKIKLQTMNHIKNLRSTGGTSLEDIGSLRLLRNLIAAHGLKGLYKGFLPTLYRTTPAAGVYMLTYEIISKETKNWSNSETMRYSEIFLAGGVAGTLAWWLVLPIDAVKSRLQADSTKNPKYHGFLSCAKELYREQSYKGFFRGIIPISIRSFPVNGITFITLEGCNYLLHEKLKL